MVVVTVLALLAIYFPTTTSTKVTVERGYNYDKIIWNGDCSKINAIHVAYDDEKICECKRIINVNGIRSEILGFVYPHKDGFLKCIYDSREIGHNLFFGSGYSSPITIISDKSFGKRFYFTNNPRSSYVGFYPNVNISIKEVRLYTFERKNPFIKIKNTILAWKNETYRAPWQRYYIKVKTRVTRKYRGNLIQMLFEKEDKEINETTLYGFAIIKFVGDRTYNLSIPSTSPSTLSSSSKLKVSKEECKYNVAAIVLDVIAVLFTLIIMVMILKIRGRRTTRKLYDKGFVFINQERI